MAILWLWLNTHVWYFIFIPVSGQVYDSHTFHETVILGNDAIFKCSIPSFVSDFVAVLGWVDSQGLELGNPTGTFHQLSIFHLDLRLLRFLVYPCLMFVDVELLQSFSDKPALSSGHIPWECHHWQWRHFLLLCAQLCSWLCQSWLLGWLGGKPFDQSNVW